MMTESERLEFEYAKKLRECPGAERTALYREAYDSVSRSELASMPEAPERRTAGTSRHLVESIARLCKGIDRVLEVGCGRGYTLLGLAKRVTSLVGIDVAEPALNEARTLLTNHSIDNVTIIKGSATDLIRLFKEEMFDKVISIDVHEHLHPDDAKNHLEQVHSILKPKGRLIVVTPNSITGPHDITKKVYPASKVALGFHLNETSCEDLIKTLKAAGFRKFFSVLPISSKLPIPFDLVYSARLFVALEKHLLKERTNSLLSGAVNMLSRIFLIAERS